MTPRDTLQRLLIEHRTARATRQAVSALNDAGGQGRNEWPEWRKYEEKQ